MAAETIEQWAADQAHALALTRPELERYYAFRDALYEEVRRGVEAFNAAIGSSSVKPIRFTAGPESKWISMERGRKAVIFGVQDQVVWTQTAVRKWSDQSGTWDHAEHTETLSELQAIAPKKEGESSSEQRSPLKYENKSVDVDEFARILIAKVIDQS
jgi:hypothetical protein